MEKSIYGEYECLYDMAAAAAALNIYKIGSGNLYYYLRELNILMSNNLPAPTYKCCGYFEIRYGTKNLKSPKTYPKTMFTIKGMHWLLEKLKDKIKNQQRIFYAKHYPHKKLPDN